MIETKKFDKNMITFLEMCSTCMKMCKDQCPTAWATKSESITPYTRSLMIVLNEKGIKEYDQAAIEAEYKCTTCWACEEACLPKVGLPNMIEIARSHIIAKNPHLKPMDEIANRVETLYNPLNEPAEERFNRLKNLLPEKKEAEYVYFIGCMACYRYPEIAESIIKLLKKTEVDFTVIIGDEWCCGSPIIRNGFTNLAKKLAQHNIDQFEKFKCKKIITGCSACYSTIKKDYTDLGLTLNQEIQHFTEFFEELRIKNNIKPIKTLDKIISYHDPCHLGRRMGVYDPPRNLLKDISGKNFVELQFNREKARCCGAGGGVKYNYTDIAKSIGIRRLEEAQFLNVDMLVSACPLCKNQFEAVQNKNNKTEIKDITEIIAYVYLD
ncbi:MAG: (Fe-S)-binding protein [Candidatus Helarchaeota archaeon]|nr:(Fe-S)-binding protein [Candidatus Helarchaeota archaeon]